MNRIKEFRKKRKKTQKELAELVGISQPFLHDLENNRRGAKPETYQRIAEALDVTVAELNLTKVG